MNPLLILSGIDLKNIGTLLDGKKFEKDAKRLGMFFVALPKRTAEMSHDPLTQTEIPTMLREAAILGAIYAKASNPKNWNGLQVLLGKDPFAGARDDVRQFAKKWKLDPAFIEAMG